MPVCGNYLFFELPKKIVLNPKDGHLRARAIRRCANTQSAFIKRIARCEKQINKQKATSLRETAGS